MTRRSGRRIGRCANTGCENHWKEVTLPAWELCAKCNRQAARDPGGPEADMVREARLKKSGLDINAGRSLNLEYAGADSSRGSRLNFLNQNQFRQVADRASDALSAPYSDSLGAIGRALKDITRGAGELSETQRREIAEYEFSPVSPEHGAYLQKVFPLVDILDNFDGLCDSNGDKVKMSFREQARLSTCFREPPSPEFLSGTLWRAFCAAAQLQPLILTIPGRVSGEKFLGVLRLDGRVHQWVTTWDGPGSPPTRARPPIIWAATQTTATVFRSAWENEIIGFDMAASCVYRACHHFNSGLAGDSQVSVSSDGSFVTFTSDWMGTLGTTDGKEPILGKNCRTDVFVVRVASDNSPQESK